MSKAPGKIFIHLNIAPDRTRIIECHVETDEAWGGYDLDAPNEGWREFSKTYYTLVEDHRASV